MRQIYPRDACKAIPGCHVFATINDLPVRIVIATAEERKRHNMTIFQRVAGQKQAERGRKPMAEMEAEQTKGGAA